MCSPVFSIIIPCFNQGQFLRDAVQSVLDQQADAEVIVVNDGSTDATRDVMASFGAAIRPIHQENQGVSAARNAGAAEASGRLLIFLDADDALVHGSLSTLQSAAEQHPESGLFYFGAYVTDERLEPQGEFKPIDLDEDPVSLLTAYCKILTTGVVCLRAEVFREVGGFDKELRNAQDWDCWIRIAESGVSFRRIDAILLNYRKHEAAATASYFKMMDGTFRVRKKHRALLRRTHRFWAMRYAQSVGLRYYWWRVQLRPHVHAALGRANLIQAARLLWRAATQDFRAARFYCFEVWLVTAGMNLALLVAGERLRKLEKIG